MFYLEPLIVAETINSRGKNITVSWCNKWTGSGNIRLCNEDDVVLSENILEINRYLGRVVDTSLYGDTCIKSKTEIDHWLTFALGQLDTKNRTHVEYVHSLIYLNKALLTRTWLCCKKFTLADIHVYCTLWRNGYLEKEPLGDYVNLTRWYKHIQSLTIIRDALIQMKKNTLPKEQVEFCAGKTNEQTKTRKQEGKFIDLPGAEMGKVVVRFPPEASGYLHIGHAKAALLNQYYAEAFKGKFIMRFDDTNPAKETTEFEEAILEDLRLLQIKPDQFTHTSDYFDILQEYCTKLIKEGKAYVDDTPAHIMKEQREQKLKSENRDNPVGKNLALWEEMRRGTEKGQACCVRAKIDYESTNGCMRDPTIYRCKLELHPYTQDKYKVYPTYDFACPIVDSIENVTHTLRTTEYHDRDAQFYWVLDALGLRRPHIWEYSRLNMTHTVLSKRKLTWFVNEGLVDGWNDPRFPTVRGILRRGMTVEGLKQFIIAQGSSRSVVFMEWDKIWAINKKVIDSEAFRYTALDYDKLVPVHVLDAKEGWLVVQNHPKHLNKGFKNVITTNRVFIEDVDAMNLVAGQSATFINWGNLKILEINKRQDGSIIDVHARLDLDNRDYKNTLKITWLVKPSGTINNDTAKTNSIPCYAVYFDHIISVPVLGKDDDFKDFVAKDTRKEVRMLGEVALQNVKKGEIIQIQRKGYFICDVPYAPLNFYSSRERPLILFHIPDGHMSTPSAVSQKNIFIIYEKFYVSIKVIKHKGDQQKSKKLKESKDKIAMNILENIGENSLYDKIKKQSKKFRLIQNVLDEEQRILNNLQAEYKTVIGHNWISRETTAPTKNEETSKAQEMSQAIQKQGDKVRNLKSSKAEKSIVDEEVKILLSLKTDYKNATGQDWKPQTEALSASSTKQISDEIQKQGDKVRNLKSSKTEKSIIDQEVKILLSLKNDYKKATGQDWKPGQVVAERTAPDTKPQIKESTRLGLEVKKDENFFDWYSQIITKSGMIEYYDVSGCYILRPWSFAIWKIIKDYIDQVITLLGVHECYFPIFVTRNVLEKEKTHIADFAPEVAWVTKCGESDLAEPIAIRPTSETIMYPAYAKWLKSDTELPLRLNQWNNVVRWEFKDPKPFLRTREFLWQEGHTAFATKAEAEEEVLTILNMYGRVYEDILAVPVIKGRKTEKEKFAGGDYTTTVEAFISTSGRAIQGATSHHLGQNFSKMFNIQVEGVEGDEKTFVYQNSWGLTTRTIGVMIMVHGDDKGLVLPPKVASIAAVVVPCGITASTTATQRKILQLECMKLVDKLQDENFKVHGDFRNNRTPGWKFNHWELKGVPVRIELGPKDLEKDQVTLVRRDTSERSTAKSDEVVTALAFLLNDIQTQLFRKARKTLYEHIKQVENWNDFAPELNKKNLLLSPFCGEPSCEERIKADSAREESDEPGASMGAKSLCIPFDQPELTKPLNEMTCIHHSCTNKPKFYTLFGRSY
ncbi:Bifunctional aminoacyl-tRNA synthetase [Ooceraea biroi]|uniref:Bifunctional glutamate/proline--tRNA ligase n=1 Tax=Ooceraea biroi TaxID=2015173 RepID=A0A026WRM1_OOCBI|nr:Bifunctional aminoacyl-tRNA synthetase [Ooceraea biroi]